MTPLIPIAVITFASLGLMYSISNLIDGWYKFQRTRRRMIQSRMGMGYAIGGFLNVRPEAKTVTKEVT